MPVAAGGDVADRCVAFRVHRLVAVGSRAVGLHDQAGERALDASLTLPQQRLAADEVALVEGDEALEPRLAAASSPADMSAPQSR